MLGAVMVSSLLGELARRAAEDSWTYYWVPGFAALAVTLLLAVVPVNALRAWRVGRPLLFVAACAVALFALRWPVFLFEHPYNVDETQFTATALGLVKNATLEPFVYATTSGPLNIWLLALPAAFGLEIDLASSRLMALACEAIMVAGCYGALRMAYGESSARLTALALVTMLGLTRVTDFVHASSEHVPVALIAVGSWLLARAMRGGLHAAPGLMLALGTVAGAVPFAKLQAAPLALAMVLFGGLVALWHDDEPRRRTMLLAALAVGTSAFGLLSAAYLGLRGRLGWYYDLYIGMNIVQAERGLPLPETIQHMRVALEAMPASRELVVWFAYSVGLLVLATGQLIGGRRSDRWAWLFSAYAAVLLAASGVAVLAPGRPYLHYLLLLVPGLSLAAAGAAVSAKPWVPRLCLLPLPVLILVVRGSVLGPVVNEPARVQLHPLAQQLRSQAQPGDRLTVWGWASWLHLETRLPQGTDYLFLYWTLTPNPRRGYFRALWLRDFKRRRPEFFVDAVARGEMWSEPADRHESFPALRAWIRHAYLPIAEPDGRRAYRARRAGSPKISRVHPRLGGAEPFDQRRGEVGEVPRETGGAVARDRP